MKCSGMYNGETNIFKVYVSKLRKGTEQEFKGSKRKQKKINVPEKLEQSILPRKSLMNCRIY